MINIRWLDFLIIFFYPIFYVSLTLIYFSATGLWVYSAMDPVKNGSFVAIIYIGCFGFYYIGYLILLGLSFGKMLLIGYLKKKYQESIWVVNKDKKYKHVVEKQMDDQELENMVVDNQI